MKLNKHWKSPKKKFIFYIIVKIDTSSQFPILDGFSKLVLKSAKIMAFFCHLKE